MSSVLYRVGGWAYRRRWIALGIWVAVLVGITVFSFAVKGSTNDAFNVPGTESQRALDLLNKKFPGTGGADARIVFAAPEGHTLDEERYAGVVEPTLALVQRVPQTVGGVPATLQSLQFSRDRRIAFADIQFTVTVDKLKSSTKAALRRVVQPARKAGLQVAFSGGVIATATGGESVSEIAGLIVAFIVLMVTFGAIVAAGLPLLTALIGVAIGLLALTGLTGLITLNSTAPTLSLMLGLAVGIDYALFIVTRHRQDLHDGLEIGESIARSIATAGGAVLFAGVTVVIALVGLTVVGIPFLSAMGLAAAGTVVIAVLIALTLLPALLGFAGDRVARGRHPPTGNTMGARWGKLVTTHPWFAIVGVVALLVVIAIPAAKLRLALPDDSTKPKNTTEHKSYDLLKQGFGPGYTGPLLVVVDATGKPRPKAIAKSASKGLGTLPDVAAVSPPVSNRSGDISIIAVTPRSGPASEATKDLVGRIRSGAAAAERRFHVTAYVTGATAINIDTSDKLSAALPTFLIIVVGLAMFLLALVFRSLLIPVKAVAGFLLTIAAALGIVTFIFQQGHGKGLLGVETTSPIISFLPVLMIAILFGLAMDYEVFLVSRMRESFVQTGDAEKSVTAGFRASVRVVTAAGLIMIAVFAGFVFGDDIVIKSIGFALAFGVLADAFLVRMTLVPAVLALVGARAWHLPKWLDKRMPNLDIEGEKLMHDLEAKKSSG